MLFNLLIISLQKDIENGSAADGADVFQWTYWGGDMQKYKIVPVSNGVYAIRTKASSNNSFVDVYNMSTASGADVVQWTYWAEVVSYGLLQVLLNKFLY